MYDALYGTDAIPETGGAERNGAFSPLRVKRVIDYGTRLLDLAAPLAEGSSRDATGHAVKDATLVVTMGGGKQVGLAYPSQFDGYNGEATAPSAILLGNHRLHLEIVIDRTGPIGKDDAAGVDDVLLESVVTTIMDCEDSVAAVDGEDKVLVYRNWLGLMKRDLSASFEKGGETLERRLNPDREYTGPDGAPVTVPGRSLMLVRWVDQGVGCSKVPDINNIGLMEDRATLRISNQHIANWLHHGICSESQVREIMRRMATVVDNQNAGDPLYTPMAPDFDTSPAFQAACELVFERREQPKGYTELVLQVRRVEAKAAQAA